MQDIRSNFKKVQEFITKSSKILLSIHIGADGDSVCSNLATYHVLKNLGKEVTVISPDEEIQWANFVPGFKEIKNVDIKDIKQEDYDLFLSLDCATWKMITRGEIPPKWLKPIIVVDHHQNNENYGTINLVDEKASSTSELLYEFFKKAKYQIPKESVQCLLGGIFSDTGGFHHTNTTATALNVASELIAMGGSWQDLIFNFLRQNSLGKLRYISLVLSKIKINEELRYAWAVISKEDLLEANVDAEDAHGVVNQYFMSIKNTDFAFLLEEYPDGKIFGMVRSRIDVDSSILSKALGGGGHKVSSGFRFLNGRDLSEIERQVHEKIREVRDQIK